MNHLQDQHVLVLGLGLSGLAMARWCLRQGARVTVADTREQPPQLEILTSECPQANFVWGALDESLLARGEWTLVARSPGLAPGQLQTVREWAETRGVPVVGELDLFAQALQALSQRERLPYRPKVLAITGTNGKTTVTALTSLLLQRAGVQVATAGNIGPSLLDVLSTAIDKEAVAQAEEDASAAEEAQGDQASSVQTPDAPDAELQTDGLPEQAEDENAEASEDAPSDEPDEEDDGPTQLEPPPIEPEQPKHLPAVWVIELSSFQLDGVSGGAWDSVPTAGTVLNLSEDHLDWHGSQAAYGQAKANVFGTHALMLLNRNDAQVMAMQPGLVTVKVGGRNRQQPARPFATFGTDAPTRPMDWGIESVNGMEWLVRALALDETRKRGRAADEAEEIYFQRLMPVEALRIRGRHNASNALAALALATSAGAALGPMLHGLREYRGEPHRVEAVAIIHDIEYFDDSKGTNVGATLAAVVGLGAERTLVVILGGDGKGQNFAPLAAPLARHARAVVLIGRDAPLIRAQMGDAMAQAQLPVLDASTLPEAVRLAAAHARPGDAVLMSPACASLDMFDNYIHRARVFVDAVTDLAHEQGVSLEGNP
ncbi:UDP-N-acetylmuramoylalanine--D-glutamate ligase [Hydrogenophaga palleronii]|uniref:UDP-N-acetylmuramoylalanine--D-glutamate ligase n=1 Tax=Hydrogenophaga palleronii TaxID=65655 RepID=A0ABU1WLM9_9BURK|nr:UDP-N-acetylmuramoyl-L-alanine--D-glutamate ligase [Hydrogenophaga palleronii]MDR7150198.1 UDP-N-acetylmuramoylalanine--D-glutamate ligase [Hydrogenophaga palleronii]